MSFCTMAQTRALCRVLDRERRFDKVGQLKSAIQNLLDEGFEAVSVGAIALAIDRLDSETPKRSHKEISDELGWAQTRYPGGLF